MLGMMRFQCGTTWKRATAATTQRFRAGWAFRMEDVGAKIKKGTCRHLHGAFFIVCRFRGDFVVKEIFLVFGTKEPLRAELSGAGEELKSLRSLPK